MRFGARRAAVAGVMLAVTAAAGGCGASSSDAHDASTSVRGATGYSAADIAFLQDMLAHDQQAVDLWAMVPGRSTDAPVTGLAGQIGVEQKSEVAGFRAQLLQWVVVTARSVVVAQQAQLDRMNDVQGVR